MHITTLILIIFNLATLYYFVMAVASSFTRIVLSAGTDWHKEHPKQTKVANKLVEIITPRRYKLYWFIFTILIFFTSSFNGWIVYV